MKTKTIKLYTLKELKEVSEKAYKKACDAIRERLIDDNFYFLSDDMNQMLSEKNIDPKAFCIDYSLSYSQGDGVCFYQKNDDNFNRLISYLTIRDYLNNPTEKKKSELTPFEVAFVDSKELTQQEKANIIDYLNQDYRIVLRKTDYHYSHARTCSIECDYYYDDDNTRGRNINLSVAKLIDIFEEVYYNLCKELEQRGYWCYDITDEDIKEYAEDYELYFDKNGEEDY